MAIQHSNLFNHPATINIVAPLHQRMRGNFRALILFCAVIKFSSKKGGVLRLLTEGGGFSSRNQK